MKRWHTTGLVTLMAIAVAACNTTPSANVSDTTRVRALAGETRDPLQWPFPANSIWNMPIHNNASYANANIGAPGQWGFASDEDVLILTPNAPLKTVYVNTAGWDASKTRCGTIDYSKQVFGGTKVPVPDNFSTDPGYSGTTPNQSAAILMPDGVTVKQTQPLHVCGNGGTVTSGGDANGAWEYPDDNLKTGDGIGGAHGGPRMSSIGGTIRVGELRPGSTLRHALKLQIDGKYLKYNDDGTRGYRWPATAADSNASWYYTGTNAQMEIGALVAVGTGFNVDGLRTEAAKIIARAFRDYGAYIVDTTGWDTAQLTYEWGPNGRFKDQFKSDWGFDIDSSPLASCTDTGDQCKFSKDMADILTQLQVITNNAAATIGGGSTTDTTNRRAGQAPPFAGSGSGSGSAGRYEAESGTVSGGAGVQNASNASGGQVVGGLNNTGSGVTVSNVDGGAGGTASVVVRFANGYSSARSLSLYANGSRVGQVSFPATGSWNSFADSATVSVTLNAGTGNTIKVQRDSGDAAAADIDYVQVTPASGSSGGTSSGGTNLVSNPGFESDFASWGNSGGTNSIATSGARTGSKALLLGSSGSNVQGERQQGVNLQAGATYVVGAYFKNDGGAWCSVGVKGSASGGWFDFHGESGGVSYTQATKTFTAPSGISFANVYVWKTASTGTCTVDDVSLFKQ
jgi:hypothetical protein